MVVALTGVLVPSCSGRAPLGSSRICGHRGRMDHLQIIVGVDGSASSWRALRWAACQAEITGRDLLVAYLSEADEQVGDYGYGAGLAADIVVALTRDHPSLPAHTVVIDGDPADFLLVAAAHAAMLVLGREQNTTSLMSLAPAFAELLARSACPVVVSDGPEAEASTSARIVLGVSGSAGGQAAMRFACTEAVRAGVPVLAVRSSSDPDWQVVEASTIPASSEIREARERDVLAACLDDARAQFPGVLISGLLTAEAIRFALARESHDASLVVLGRGPMDDVRGQRPGPDTLIAVYSLFCAVAVVGPVRGAGGRGGGDAARAATPSGLDRRLPAR